MPIRVVLTKSIEVILKAFDEATQPSSEAIQITPDWKKRFGIIEEKDVCQLSSVDYPNLKSQQEITAALALSKKPLSQLWLIYQRYASDVPVDNPSKPINDARLLYLLLIIHLCEAGINNPSLAELYKIQIRAFVKALKNNSELEPILKTSLDKINEFCLTKAELLEENNNLNSEQAILLKIDKLKDNKRNLEVNLCEFNESTKTQQEVLRAQIKLLDQIKPSLSSKVIAGIQLTCGITTTIGGGLFLAALLIPGPWQPAAWIAFLGLSAIIVIASCLTGIGILTIISSAFGIKDIHDRNTGYATKLDQLNQDERVYLLSAEDTQKETSKKITDLDNEITQLQSLVSTKPSHQTFIKQNSESTAKTPFWKKLDSIDADEGDDSILKSSCGESSQDETTSTLS